MTILEQINNDLTISMKSNDKFTLSVLRMLKSALQLEKINKKADLTDEETISVIRKQVKIRKDSMEEYLSYNRNDLAETLKNEIEVLDKYLPQLMNEDEINKVIDEIFAELKPEGIKQMGEIMKVLGEKIGTKADMSIVSKIVRERLIK